MRTIKFRGRTNEGNWVFGDLLTNHKTPEILAYKGQYTVEKETIGQFTGLLDKNGKEIYEGDIITCINKSDSVYEIGRQMIGFVAYEENGCYWFCKNNFQHYNDWAFADDIEVIGNIYDNEELLKEK